MIILLMTAISFMLITAAFGMIIGAKITEGDN
jgi:hypothetical protein